MTYVFDIDDTILFSKLENGKYTLQSYSMEMRDAINGLYDEGNTIIIHTGRHWNHFEITSEQLKSIGLKYHTVICGKPVADYYIDDKGLRPDEFLGR